MATPTLKYVAPTTPEDELTFAPEPVVIYGVPSGGGGGDVASVNGKTGAVVLNAADVGGATSAQGALADTAVQPADLSAYVPTSRTVAGKALTADVTLAKADVGLGSVDNTSDANKPVSTAQQTALNDKVNTADVAGLNTVGWGRAVFIPNGGTVPGGTPAYTIVIEAGA